MGPSGILNSPIQIELTKGSKGIKTPLPRLEEGGSFVKGNL